jgi:hypothetical protein
MDVFGHRGDGRDAMAQTSSRTPLTNYHSRENEVPGGY